MATSPGIAYRLGFGFGGLIVGFVLGGILLAGWEEIFTHSISHIVSLLLAGFFIYVGVAALAGQRPW